MFGCGGDCLKQSHHIHHHHLVILLELFCPGFYSPFFSVIFPGSIFCWLTLSGGRHVGRWGAINCGCDSPSPTWPFLAAAASLVRWEESGVEWSDQPRSRPGVRLSGWSLSSPGGMLGGVWQNIKSGEKTETAAQHNYRGRGSLCAQSFIYATTFRRHCIKHIFIIHNDA